jgi:protein SCO1/2
VGDPRRVIILAILAIVAGAQSTSLAHTMAKIEAELVAGEPHVELINERAPEFSLQDLDGRPVRLSDFRGKVVLLSFVEARCRGTCPSQSMLIAKVQALQADAEGLGEQVQFVSVATGTDSSVETATVMRERGLNPTNWILLRGGPDHENAGKDLAKTYGLEFVGNSTDQHIRDVVTQVIDSQGRLRARFHGLEFNPVRLMIYAAALAHGGHELEVGEAAQSGDLDRRLILGALSSGVGLLVALVWLTWLRRNG